MRRVVLWPWFRRALRLPIILAFAVVVFFIWYIHQNIDQLKQLVEISYLSIVMFSVLLILLICIRGVSNFIYYRKLGALLSLNEGIGLAFMNRLANELPFFGGIIAKGAYLKKKHNISYAGFLPATMALYLCYISVSGLAGLFVLAFFFFSRKSPPSLPLLGLFFAMAVSCMLLWVPIRFPSLPMKWKRLLESLKVGWRVLADNSLLTVKILTLDILAILVHSMRLLIVFRAFSQDIGFMECVLFSSATVLTRLISITPGAIGIREGIIAIIAGVYGVDLVISAIVVGADRLLGTLVISIFGGFYTYSLTRSGFNTNQYT